QALAYSSSCAEHAAGGRNVPAAPIVAGRYGVSEPAFDFDPQHESVEQLRSGDPTFLSQGEQSWCNRSRRVDDRPRVSVIEVENIAAEGVQERGVQAVDAL